MSRHEHDKIWSGFLQWSSKRKLRALPAHPWTIAAYLRWLDAREEGGMAESVIKSISRAHILRAQRSPHDHPVVVRTVMSIVRRRKSAPDRSNLFDGKDFLIKHTDGIDNDEYEDGHDDGSVERETEVQIIRRGIPMRSTPKLVRRRNRQA